MLPGEVFIGAFLALLSYLALAWGTGDSWAAVFSWLFFNLALGTLALCLWVLRRSNTCSFVLILVVPILTLTLGLSILGEASPPHPLCAHKYTWWICLALYSAVNPRWPDSPPDPDGCDRYPGHLWTMAQRAAWRHECKCCRNARFCRPREQCPFDPRSLPPPPATPRSHGPHWWRGGDFIPLRQGNVTLDWLWVPLEGSDTCSTD